MTARLVLDPTRCAGHGICSLILGGAMELDQWGFPVPDGRPVGDGRPRRRALRAVAACPRGALSLEEDPAPAEPGEARPRAGQPGEARPPADRLPVTPARPGAPLRP